MEGRRESVFPAMITSESKSQLRILCRQKHRVFCWEFDSKQLAGVTVINLNGPQTHTHTQTGRQAGGQTGRQAGGQTGGQSGKGADMRHTHLCVKQSSSSCKLHTYVCRGVSVCVCMCVCACVYLCARTRDLCPHDCARVGFCLLKRQLSLTSW